MLNNWKDKILNNWSVVRFIRLGLAIMVLYEAIKNYDMLFAVLGGVILLQALLNVGCCGAGGCEVNPESKKPESLNNSKEEILFTEVK